ncbi:MAG: fused MFS/spermidine synthase [Desulfobacterales bacterium]|nr:fused MFS/spermidine synthase [Desulfobacterales bacterium]
MATVRFDKQSEFERILVVDKADRRYLRFGAADNGYQSSISLSDPEAVPMEYIRAAMLGMVMAPEPERVLMVGLGGGAFTSLLRRHFPNLWIDAVEIDPVVVEAAGKFFNVREDERFRIYVEDGAKFIQDAQSSYDLILLDAYSGEGVPEKLVSREFFQAVKTKMNEGGVVAANLWQQGRREEAIAGAFHSVFAQSACIRTQDRQNLVLFGKAGGMPSSKDLVRAARRFTAASGLSFDLAEIAQRIVVSPRAGAPFCKK